jgi:hypothetical protein
MRIDDFASEISIKIMNQQSEHRMEVTPYEPFPSMAERPQLCNWTMSEVFIALDDDVFIQTLEYW